MNELSPIQIIPKSSDDNSDNVYILRRKIEKYIISFTLHKHSNVASDLSKLRDFCDKLQQYNQDSIWIVK